MRDLHRDLQIGGEAVNSFRLSVYTDKHADYVHCQKKFNVNDAVRGSRCSLRTNSAGVLRID